MISWQRHRTGCSRSPVRTLQGSLPLPQDALHADGALVVLPGMLFPSWQLLCAMIIIDYLVLIILILEENGDFFQTHRRGLQVQSKLKFT